MSKGDTPFSRKAVMYLNVTYNRGHEYWMLELKDEYTGMLVRIHAGSGGSVRLSLVPDRVYLHPCAREQNSEDLLTVERLSGVDKHGGRKPQKNPVSSPSFTGGYSLVQDGE